MSGQTQAANDGDTQFPALLMAGADETPIYLDAYLNRRGLITIRISEDLWVEVSPIIAREFVEQINSAVRHALGVMLTPTRPPQQ